MQEYVSNCPVLRGGQIVEIPAMTNREEFMIDGVVYEASHASLCEVA